MNSFYSLGKEIERQKPDAIIIISPHAETFADSFQLAGGSKEEMSLASFGAAYPILKMEYDEELRDAIYEITRARNIPVHIGKKALISKGRVDHGSFVPLYFVAAAGVKEEPKKEITLAAKLVRLSFSGFSSQVHQQFGMAIRDAVLASDKKVIVIASGDLSHRLKKDGPYGLSPRAEDFDQHLTLALAKGDFDSLMSYEDDLLDEVAECGLRSFQILGGILAGANFEPELLSYEGVFGVGYAQAAFRRIEYAKEHRQISWLVGKDPYIALARHTIENYVRTGQVPKLSQEEEKSLPAEMILEKAGTFVTLHKEGDLRGCIGTISPVQKNIAAEIISNAISAASKDPRFFPVQEEELPQLTYSVDLLLPPEKIEGPEDLDIKRYGVIVSSRGRRGLLLPNIEGISSVREQIDIAREKAGIGPGQEIKLERFEVIRHQ